MRTSSSFIATLARIALATSALALSGCALHEHSSELVPLPARMDVTIPADEILPIVLPDIDLPARTSSEADAAPRATYVVASRSFEVRAYSRDARDVAVAALSSTANAFTQLLGVLPVHINVAAGELSAGDARFEAAASWMDGYYSDWAQALSGDETPEPGDNIVIPDWLQVGALRLITARDAKPDPSAADTTFSLAALFAYHLTPEQAAVAEQVLRSEGNTGLATEDVAELSPIDRQCAIDFVDQAASVLRYLRASQGADKTAQIFGASIAGFTMQEILDGLAITPPQLDAQWRQWQTIQKRGQ